MQAEIERQMQSGRWDDALRQCQDLLQTQPVNAKLNAYLGICHFRKNEFELAATAFRRAITLDPQMWEAATKLVQCLDRLMQYKEALQIGEHYLHLRPNDHALQTLVNGLRRQQGAVEEESWQKSVKPGHHNFRLTHE